MEEFCESTTTDETPHEDYLLADKCELIIDVNPAYSRVLN